MSSDNLDNEVEQFLALRGVIGDEGGSLDQDEDPLEEDGTLRAGRGSVQPACLRATLKLTLRNLFGKPHNRRV